LTAASIATSGSNTLVLDIIFAQAAILFIDRMPILIPVVKPRLPL
jgi:hypothetical protein